MSDYKFTQDWFHWAPPVWEQFIPMLPARKSFLEIGSYEGRSTVWITENMMEDGGTIVAVDTWEGGEEHATVGDKMSVVEERFDINVQLVQQKLPQRSVCKWKGSSFTVLGSLIHEAALFDFVYIDGSHQAPDVLTDACMAWPLLKQGGILVFDDYTWGPARDILHRPKIAIDSFVNIFAEQLDIVAIGYQLGVRKK